MSASRTTRGVRAAVRMEGTPHSHQEEVMSVEPNPVRASDADRERVVARLTAAVGDGTLTLVEVEERQTAAYAARFRHELAPLTADLPSPPVPAVRRARPPVRAF